MNTLDAPSLLLAVPAVASLVYFVAASILLHRWLGESPTEKTSDELPAVTFFRPLKAGVPDLPSKLTVLARALRPGDELLIGAETESAEWTMAEELRRAHADLEIVVVPCEPDHALNPKIAKLLQMEPHARREHWILSDSEAVMDADFLTKFRREWTRCDVLTAGYRFSHVATWPQRLDAAAVLLTLWPGLAVLRASGWVRLTLGACTGFRRSDLVAVGGWCAFADDLAEDNRLGQALAAAGRTIRLSAHVVTLECDPLSWRDYWRHQRRVAVTYRVGNPEGFAGAILTHGVTTSLMLVCWRPAEIWAWLLLLGVFVVRWLTACRAAKALNFLIAHLALVVLVASVVEAICWVLGWGAQHVWWGGVRRRISRTGGLLPEETR
jgi:ceramide glucosyltransferase